MFKMEISELIPRIIMIAVILAVMIVLMSIIKKVAKKINQRDLSQEHETLVRVVANIIKGVVVALAILSILQVCGINVTGTVAGLGVASIIVSVALQDYIKDIICGMRIMNDKFFMIGDVIEYNDKIGVVVEFNIKVTKIKLIVDNSIITISNRLIDSCRKYPDIIPVGIEIPVSYDLKTEVVDSTFKRAEEKIRSIKDVKDARYDGPCDFNEFSISYKIIVYCNPQNRYMVNIDSHRCIFEEMQKDGINVPYSPYICPKKAETE